MTLEEEIRALLRLTEEEDYITWRPMEQIGDEVTRYGKANRLPLLTAILKRDGPLESHMPKAPQLVDVVNWIGHKPGCTVITAPPDGPYDCSCGLTALRAQLGWPL